LHGPGTDQLAAGRLGPATRARRAAQGWRSRGLRAPQRGDRGGLSAGIAFEIIPGVTAATAAAARLGISLTERGSASTVVFATGTDQTGHRPSALDWDVLARAEGTLVFYMSVGALDSITASLTSLGRDPREPAILVEQAGVAGERVIAARLGEIAAEARAAAVKSPAVLITGPTVSTASVPLTVRRISSPVSV